MVALAPRAPEVLAPYNVTLTATSPLFNFGPVRDTIVTQGWNASFAGETENPADAVPVRRTQAQGSRVTFEFDGTGLFLCFTSGGASFALTLDGRLVHTTTSAANQPACAHAKGEADTLLYAGGLEYDTHAVVLQVAAAAEREFRFFGGALEIGVQTGGKVVDDSVVVDDQDPGWSYAPGRGSGLWDFSAGDRHYNLTSTFECNYGGEISATYKFSGAGGAVLLGTISPAAHDFNVQLDDRAAVNLDATAALGDGAITFYITGAIDPALEHTLVLRNYNSGGRRYGGFNCLGIDALVLLRPGEGELPPGTGSVAKPDLPPDDNGQGQQPPDNNGQQPPSADDGQQGPNPDPSDPPSTSTSKSSTAAIAGGVVGGLVGALLLAVLAFFVVRSRRERKKEAEWKEGAFDGPAPMMTHLPSPWVAPPPPQGGGAGAGAGADGGHWSPYAATTTSNSSVAAWPVDRKQRNVNVLSAASPSVQQTPNAGQDQRQVNADAGPSSPRAATGSPDSAHAPGGPRLAQHDLEEVLAFVAQRMDRDGARAPVASTRESDGLPQYRG